MGDIAGRCEHLAVVLSREVVQGRLTADALSVASILRHFARELRAGRLDTPAVVGSRIAGAALAAAEKAVRE